MNWGGMMRHVVSVGWILAVLPLGLVAAPNPDLGAMPAGRYVLDKRHASVVGTVGHFGLSNYTFRFDKIDASFDYDPGNPQAFKLEVSIDTRSMNTGLAEADKKFPVQFLAADKAPQATFVSTAMQRVGTKNKVTGNLTLAGVTRPATLDVTFNGHGASIGPANRAGFSATTTIKRSDFGSTDRLPLVSDEVALAIEVEFERQETKAAGVNAQTPAQFVPSQAAWLDADGTLHSPQVTVPLSRFLSSEAKTLLRDRMHAKPSGPANPDIIARIRGLSLEDNARVLQKWLEIYPATIEPKVIGGVQTDVIVPKAGIDRRNNDRVLINLRGGHYIFGSRVQGQAESVPVAGRGRIKVITIDYRQAPEHAYPSSSQDVVSVYRELLKTYRPQRIGIFGNSAGGTLAAQVTARLQKENLPAPGAIGMFGSGFLQDFWFGGDSFAVQPVLNATPLVTSGTSTAGADHFAGVDQNDPLVTPGLYPDVLAKFPPTLFVSSTRDPALSNTVASNAQLLRAGGDAQLFVVEGLGHVQFNTFAGTPEAMLTYNVIWRFFDERLGF